MKRTSKTHNSGALDLVGYILIGALLVIFLGCVWASVFQMQRARTAIDITENGINAQLKMQQEEIKNLQAATLSLLEAEANDVVAPVEAEANKKSLILPIKPGTSKPDTRIHAPSKRPVVEGIKNEIFTEDPPQTCGYTLAEVEQHPHANLCVYEMLGSDEEYCEFACPP